MSRLTIEKVFEAVIALKKQGKKPTNRAIIDYVGYGSFSTLTQLRQSHPEIFVANDDTKRDTEKTDTLTPPQLSRLEARLKAHLEARLAQTKPQNSRG